MQSEKVGDRLKKNETKTKQQSAEREWAASAGGKAEHGLLIDSRPWAEAVAKYESCSINYCANVNK